LKIPARSNKLVAALAVICVTGCGDDGSPSTTSQPDTPLTRTEMLEEDRAVATIRAYCRDVARYLSGRGDRPSDDRALAAARRIAALARRKPEARYRGGQTARQVAGDLAEDLEGTNCSDLLVAELEQGLRPL
jgi:hypothetical protein